MEDDNYLEQFFSSFSERLWQRIYSELEAGRNKKSQWLDEQAFANADRFHRTLSDLHGPFHVSPLKEFLERELFNKFLHPPATLGEVTELILMFLAGSRNTEEVAAARQQFLAHLDVRTFRSRSDTNCSAGSLPFVSRVGVQTFGDSWKKLEQLANDSELLCVIGGFEIRLTTKDKDHDLRLFISGRASDLAIDNLFASLQRILPSLQYSLRQAFERESGDGFLLAIGDLHADKFAQDLVKLKNSTLARLLQAYYMPDLRSKTAFSQRMKNATHLLVEADLQQNKAVALSLAWVAIEALVCDNSHGIVDELTRHLAALLEPNSIDRPTSIKRLKDLYDKRSKTLHGVNVRATDEDFSTVRRLATAVQFACIQWERYQLRMGGDASREDLIDQLRNISVTGKTFVGAEEDLRRFLPRESKSFLRECDI